MVTPVALETEQMVAKGKFAEILFGKLIFDTAYEVIKEEERRYGVYLGSRCEVFDAKTLRYVDCEGLLSIIVNDNLPGEERLGGEYRIHVDRFTDALVVTVVKADGNTIATRYARYQQGDYDLPALYTLFRRFKLSDGNPRPLYSLRISEPEDFSS